MMHEYTAHGRVDSGDQSSPNGLKPLSEAGRGGLAPSDYFKAIASGVVSPPADMARSERGHKSGASVRWFTARAAKGLS